jgi:hypothetical protein
MSQRPEQPHAGSAGLDQVAAPATIIQRTDRELIEGDGSNGLLLFAATHMMASEKSMTWA